MFAGNGFQGRLDANRYWEWNSSGMFLGMRGVARTEFRTIRCSKRLSLSDLFLLIIEFEMLCEYIKKSISRKGKSNFEGLG